MIMKARIKKWGDESCRNPAIQWGRKYVVKDPFPFTPVFIPSEYGRDFYIEVGGRECLCLEKHCSQIGGGEWEILEE